MLSFKLLLCALTVSLLAAAVECGHHGRVLPPGADSNHNGIESEEEDSHESPVVRAEKVVRPLRSLQSTYGPISHSGVRVTLEDGSQWLIHKGPSSGPDSPMVVSSAENMSSKWKTVEIREFNGRKMVADFVKAGGDAYDVRRANCHHATDAMMNLCT